MEWCYMSVYDSNYLAHHGIMGQKWGVRRFQNKDGSLTPEGRIRYKVNENGDLVKRDKSEIKELKKQHKAEQAESKRQRRLQLEKEELEEKKARLLKEKNPAAILENADLFTYQELNDVYNRMNLERNVANLVPKEKKAGYSETVDALARGVGSTANLIKKGSELYNNFAEVYNTVGGDLPLVGKEPKPKETERQKEIKNLKEENELLRAREDNKKLKSTESEDEQARRRLREENERLANTTLNYRLRRGYNAATTLSPEETQELNDLLRFIYSRPD